MARDHLNISINDYTYHLPQERIALYPLEKRDASSLLVYRGGNIEKTVFGNLPDYLTGPALMVFNNTRVVQARLLFRKESGAQIEIFCLEPSGGIRDVQVAFQQMGQCQWFCLVGNAKKWKKDPLILKINDQLTLSAHKGEARHDGYLVTFNWEGNISFAEVLEMIGKTPLPPYINRSAEESDKERYQTIFARHKGSVAAPTAGLHFTPVVMETLEKRGIEKAWLTLHVGAGTFKPVSASTIGQHQMHQEQVVVDSETIQALMRHINNNVISVGTTSMRTLESLYWLGVKLIRGYTIPPEGFEIGQWEPYEHNNHPLPTALEALNAIANHLHHNKLSALHGETSLIIVPGYTFRIVKTLVTNFHQPGSTLLLLVAAFCGPDWRNIYQFALENDFRFLSYGDSCLLFG